MWRVWVGFLLLATPAWAEENGTAYEALRVLGSEFGRDALHHIVSIHGTKGDPQPEKWKIVVEDPQGGGVRELRVAGGKIDPDDEADREACTCGQGAPEHEPSPWKLGSDSVKERGCLTASDP